MSASPDENPDPQAEGLPDLLKGWARASPDGRLILCVALGVLVAAGAAWWRIRGWPAAFSAALCAFAFGAWGIADREILERTAETGAGSFILRAVRATAGAVGWLALSGLVFSLLSVGLGLWKS